ncbi:UDP-N-acetylmuramoyl-L-alanine--D-glutamate ligase [Breznakia sp. OttesenSCG-928-G09]|nr:UDP-N-acetylmuramoyl-L-alanine--D-glutamate ligase [Breznakia sp. OttesenSCG-928-G09]
MKSVLVIGAARSGVAVSKLLQKKNFQVFLTDAKSIQEKQELEAMGIKVFDEGHPDFLKEQKYDFIVKNPGIPYYVPFIAYFVDEGYKIYTEIEVASWYANDFHYAAVTGTNGKTTTVSILYALLNEEKKAYAAGNIGTPLSELVLSHEDEDVNVALELSNFQLLGVEKFKPKVSTVTNLAPDHLDYMKDLDAYYKSKMKIYECCDETDFFLRNIDDENVLQYATNIPCNIIDYSLTKKADLYIDNNQVYYKDTKLFDIDILKLVGKHNVANSMVAACMAYILGVSLEHIQSGLKMFKSVEHRLEYVAKKDGVLFYNDSKATNAEAVVPALEAFDRNIILLAGGYDKKLSFDILKPYDNRVKKCFSFGETKNLFLDVFTNTETCETMEEAFQKAVMIAQTGDVVLLSPACASYDQFVSYEQRGMVFKELVETYINGGKIR